MTDLRLILAAALGISIPAHAQQPGGAIPEATETPPPDPSQTPVTPETSTSVVPPNCAETLGAARCDPNQLLHPDVAIALAQAVWAVPADSGQTRAMLATPIKQEELATGHLMYRVNRHDGGRNFVAVVDAETGVVLEHYIAHIRRGRPLMGLDGPIRAPLTDASALTPLAQAWADAALDEAASVRAFEVHALELTAIGAPASFITRALQAADDERRHAIDAFAIASRLTGRPLQDGELPETAPPRDRLYDVAQGVLLEGCLNETLALAEAREALARCVDPNIRTALIDVVREETQHAELAFETLRWLLLRLTPTQRDALRGLVLAYETPLASHEVPDGFGVLPRIVADEVRQTTMNEVLRPLLLTAICSGTQRPGPRRVSILPL